ncbi:chaperone modulator CbpM [Chlorogloeopsis sp. ULAP01]|uniref:chaperone modulator CbpM n=1 Tax=Chlorogloeopsis sp. ULAP01 TaxID=3056483 RepID=UPI0025AAE4D2|nr:chaperone modulator CbpM [Chlorogloeopsis sp. ULAP01]MDM9383248.1 chaperone modulator CbpM [Chlorogloeopsis sp. ULAP01]
MNSAGLSRVVISEEGDRLYTFEYAALVTQTSTALIERFATLGLISPTNSMLRSRDITRVSQILRLRRDLGLNLVGAAMVLDMAEEIAQLRAQLQAYRSHSS